MQIENIGTPHNELTHQEKRIRTTAFLLGIAVLLSYAYVLQRHLAEFFAGRVPLGHGLTEGAIMFSVLATLCWRTWCLKSWACWTLFHMLGFISFWLLIFTVASPLFLIWPVLIWTAMGFLFKAINETGPRLKTGF